MAKLVCPFCGAFTSLEPIEFVARVKIQGTSGLRYEVGKASAIDYDEVGEVSHGIVECKACGRRFVAIGNNNDEWAAVYPIATKYVDPDIDEPMRGEFKEALLCFAVGAYRGCASMCVTTLEALWRDQKASGLKDLKEKGIISQKLFEKGDEVRLWGDIAKHEFVPDVVKKEDAEELITYLEAILNDVYVEQRRISRFAEKRKELELKKKE